MRRSTRNWNRTVVAFLATGMGAFVFLFRPEVKLPGVGEVPAVLWSSFAVTVLLVVLTYLGARVFPHQEE